MVYPAPVRRLLPVLLTTSAVIAMPAVAFAADTDLEQSETDVFELAPLAVTVILGTVIPLLTGLLTKLNASPAVKGTINLLLAAIAGVITASLVEGGAAVFSSETLILAGLAWVQSVAAYLGFWQNININAKLAPGVGVG